MQSTKPWPKANNILLWLLAATAAVGLTDAVYLTITHYTNTLVPCSFSHGCEIVLRSQYAEVFGIPVAALGVLFYSVVLIASIFFVTNKQYHWALSVWGLMGFVSTLYLLYIQAFVLHAYCQYCLLSTFSSTLTFIITAVLYYINKHKEKPHDNQTS
jgi:uncharacterized membrane protein